MLGGDDILMDHADLLDTVASGLPQDASDSSDSGLDCGSVVVKDEPLSPASSMNSDTQIDGATIQVSCRANTGVFDIRDAHTKLTTCMRLCLCFNLYLCLFVCLSAGYPK